MFKRFNVSLRVFEPRSMTVRINTDEGMYTRERIWRDRRAQIRARLIWATVLVITVALWKLKTR